MVTVMVHGLLAAGQVLSPFNEIVGSRDGPAADIFGNGSNVVHNQAGWLARPINST